MKNISKKPWYNGAVIACIGVILYCILTNLPAVLSALGTFVGYFRAVILGAVFAYLLSPLAIFFSTKLFRGKVFDRTRWVFSVILAVAVMLLALTLLIGTLLPQLIESILLFSANVDGYATSLIQLIETSPLYNFIDQESFMAFSQNSLTSVTDFIKENAGNIVGFAASSGKNIASIVIAMILAIYILMDSKRVVNGIKKLCGLLLPEKGYKFLRDFVVRCDDILISYIVQSLLDALIIGSANAVFMTVAGMPYVGLISVVVGVTNLVPNFGPIVGGAIGAFILILIKPMSALVFVIFCLLLQTIDGYFLKPRLFSGSLGVSGLLILSSTIVLGNMFSVLGILLSIPTAAVLSFVYHDYLLPWLRKRKQKEADPVTADGDKK
ncbi:MAG: AI-2E family transporter [Lachnospiraceae bacterium]|nr:AI-2E family transporter [Lachnospiraceae bacterium]